MPSALAAAQHEERARHHLQVGDALEAAASEEWAAVAYFYSAYHQIKRCMLEDPIWRDPTQLHAKHIDLVSDDRFTESHHGHKASAQRRWGVNELVQLLYPNIVYEYEQLHQASIAVRYSRGLAEGALPALKAAAEKIQAEANAGHLIAGS